jgi:ankyrin repeat protein
MKKTILTSAMALAIMVVSANAENKTDLNDATVITTTINRVDVSSFCKAIMQGDVDMVKRLIALGEDVNQKSLGMTPAIFAARYNKVEILELLIAEGADLKTKSDKGMTAKKYAKMSNANEALSVIESALKR